MGIIESGPLGPFRNKVGPVVGRKHMGQDVITSVYHKSNKKHTPAQFSEQTKFGLLNGFIADIAPLIKLGFGKYARKKSAKNAAFSYNYGHAFIPEGETWGINYPAMVYSRGDIVAPSGLTLSLQDDVLSFHWSAQPQSLHCQYTDLASFLVYCPAKERGIIRVNVAERHLLGFDVQLADDYTCILHCYVNFSSADGKVSGDNKYAGGIVFDDLTKSV